MVSSTMPSHHLILVKCYRGISFIRDPTSLIILPDWSNLSSRRCQFHVLPASFQIKLLDDPKDWKAMTEVVWLDCLMRAEEYDKQILESKERIAKKQKKATS